ncbi:MAG: type II toxin-antitoxin system RelE/ParE family toxin [Acidobacteriaceae bacterium]
MTIYRLGRKVESYLEAILDYSVDNWGEEQAEVYRSGLERCFETLAASPMIGRACGALHPELRRMECGSYVIFYLPMADGVRIVRVLHQRALPQRNRFLEM